MVIWVSLAIAAQFLYAISVLIDRHIVVRAQHIGKPIVYAFYVSLLSGFVIVLAPLGLVSWPSPHAAILALLNAGTFVAAIFFLYCALRLARASDAAPVIGAVSAITSLILAGLFITGDVTGAFIAPILLLAAGTALISHFHFSRKAILYTLLSGVMFGTMAFTFKLVTIEMPFLDSFFWTRMMNVGFAAALLIVPSFRSAILHGGTRSSRGSKALIIGNKVIGGFAGVLTSLAISLGSVAIVNALAGLQFVFLFLFAVLFAEHMPLREKVKTGSHGGWQTFIGVGLIVVGLAALYLWGNAV